MTIEQRLERIEQLLIINQKNVLNTKEAALIMDISPQRLSALCSDGRITYYRDSDRRKRYFLKTDIERYMLRGRVESDENIDNKAATYIALKNAGVHGR